MIVFDGRIPIEDLVNLSAAQIVSNLIKFDVGVLLIELIILICKYLACQQHIVVLFTNEHYLFSLNNSVLV